MDDCCNVAELLDGVKNDANDVATRFFELYEPYVRRVIRKYLRDNRIRRLVDSTDLTQDVMLALFQILTDRRVAIESEEHVRRLLACLARRVTFRQIRRNYRAQRDVRRTVRLAPNANIPASAQSNRLEVAKENLDRIISGLSENEARIVKQRLAGNSWEELAARERTTSDAIRMRIVRALRHAAKY